MMLVCVVTTPKAKHWTSMKRVLIYVKWTLEFGVLYIRTKDPQLCGHSISNWVGCVDEKKYTSRYAFILGIGAVSWVGKKHVISLSFTKVQ